MQKTKRYVLGVSGASGAVYAFETARHILASGAELYCSASAAAKSVMEAELGSSNLAELLETRADLAPENLANFKYFDNTDFSAPQASGSFNFEAAIIAPCSVSSVGKLANGIADNVFLRAAETALRMKRRLVLVPRETPLAPSHLRNMAYLAECGAVILPPSPAFYHTKNPTAQDLIDFVTARILSAAGIEQNLVKEWGL